MVNGNDDDRFDKMEGDYELGQWILTGSSKKSGSSKKKSILWLFDLPKQFDTKGFAEKIKELKLFTEKRPNTSSKSLKIFEFDLNGKSYEIDEEPVLHVQNSIALIPRKKKTTNIEEDGDHSKSGSGPNSNKFRNSCFSTGEFRRSFIVRERQKTRAALKSRKKHQEKKKNPYQQQLGLSTAAAVAAAGGVQTRTMIRQMSCKPICFSPIGYVAPLQRCDKDNKHFKKTATKMSRKKKEEATMMGKKKRKKSNRDELSSLVSSAPKKRKKSQHGNSNVEKKRKRKKSKEKK
mmetsp:Transcript_27973/g.39054  ORF Transcript_27973/g.39054 Transcript_27973/m.39054 type:complete len:291 (+) Transcript_27973:190-1062(+)|eukprot:CAMPEP_0185253274 /NCGR_PEP_ID=MMETSP1359-20130426/2099_1 /TAXON_ID=552665 /ORGANISM="Bigelowiella longifila, Strain CCMP242" /LENGTH=290 /DNA_ID=CAMNT_0027835635 /DNA_START=125 /DNA_END=997 /DNA_ORIENTATION=-